MLRVATATISLLTVWWNYKVPPTVTITGGGW